jgi:hypothetical protein
MSATGALAAIVLALLVGLGQFGLHKIPEGAMGSDNSQRPTFEGTCWHSQLDHHWLR